MSSKTSFKRIALVAASALAIAGFSAVPANAAGTYTGTLVTVGAQTLTGSTTAAASITVATGVALSYTLLVTGSATPAADDTFTVTPTVTSKPTVSKLAVSDLGPVVGTLLNSTNTITASTGVSAFVTATTSATTGATTYTITPDAVGVYVITHVTTTSGTAAANAILTVTATANTGSVSSMTVSNKAVASGNTVVNSSLTYTTSSTTITSGAASFATAQVGQSVWTNDDGYIGTIASVTTAGGGAVATLATAYAGTSRVANLFWLGTLASTTVSSGIVASTITGMTVPASASSAIVLNFAAGTVGTAATGRITVGGTKISAANTNVRLGDSTMYLSFTAPVVAGTYVATVSLSNAGTYTGTGADTASMSFTLTVTANAGLSTALSTAYMAAAGTGAAAYTSTTNAVPRSGAKATGTDLASIKVTLLNSTGLAHTGLSTVTATIAGAGYVLVDTTAGTTTVGTLRASVLAADAGGLAYVHVDADGTSGTGTVTVSVTDSATLVTTVLGTFTVTSYGAATKIEVSTTNYTIGRAGGFTTGAAIATRTADEELLGATNVLATVPAFIIKVTDSAGNLVNLTSTTGAAIVPTVASDTLTASGGGTCVLDSGAETYGSGTGVGYYNCNFSTAASSASGGKATLTVSTPNPADTTTNLTATVAITVGGSIETETIATDADSYDAGQGMTITQTAKDASGNAVFDGASAPAITANKALGGTTPAGGFYVAGTLNSDSSTGAKTVFAPAVVGTLTLQATSNNAAGSTITASATVTGDESSALALDAANAATDAANNAYDEAQNATQAASDALDAVTALAKQVTKLIKQVDKAAKAIAAYKERTGR